MSAERNVIVMSETSTVAVSIKFERVICGAQEYNSGMVLVSVTVMVLSSQGNGEDCDISLMSNENWATVMASLEEMEAVVTGIPVPVTVRSGAVCGCAGLVTLKLTV